MIKPIIAILVLASMAAADLCRIVALDKDSQWVTITCSTYAPGVNVTFRAFSRAEWAAVSGVDTVAVQDTTKK